MVNDLMELMRENVASPPPDHLDLDAVVRVGRRRVRARRAAAVGTAGLLVAGVVAGTVAIRPAGSGGAGVADTPPSPDAPTMTLAKADLATDGRDYRVLASHTDQDLDTDNGQYFDGVTDDGLVLFRDGPRKDQLFPRYALMDPATGSKDWLPNLDVGQTQLFPAELGKGRLVLVSSDPRSTGRLVAYVFDRAHWQWHTMTWTGLPDLDEMWALPGPDGRLYVQVPATKGKPPAGGWPTGPDGEADDANAQGDTFHLWSVSLTDEAGVRDERLTLGALAFTETSMVWTDSTNGHAGLVHVRDLSTGTERSFDPHAGRRCNLQSLGATDDRVVLSQYCGTYAGGVRDDRVQILTTDGHQVVTLQDSGIGGWMSAAGRTGDLVVVTAYQKERPGTYLYDLRTDRFLRITDATAHFDFGGGPVPDGRFLFSVPVNDGHGMEMRLGEVVR